MEGIQKEAGSGPFKKKHFSLARSLCHEFFPIEKQISLSLSLVLSLSHAFSLSSLWKGNKFLKQKLSQNLKSYSTEFASKSYLHRQGVVHH